MMLPICRNNKDADPQCCYVGIHTKPINDDGWKLMPPYGGKVRIKPLRPEESAAAERLKLFLVASGHQVYYEPGEDPPDLAFHVDEVLWAVEHTTLYEYVDANGEQSRQAVSAQAATIEELLNGRMQQKLSCKWFLYLPGRLPNRKQVKAVVSCVEEAIQTDNPRIIDKLYPQIEFGMPPADSEKIALMKLEAEGGPFRIVVASALPSSSVIPGTGTHVALVSAQIAYGFNRILEQKAKKLRNIHGYAKVVLLVENEYFAATRKLVSEYLLSEPDHASRFNLIFFRTDDEIALVGGKDA